MPYGVGTVATQTGSKTIIGTGTNWEAGSPQNVKPGDSIRISGWTANYRVMTVGPGDVLTIDNPWQGTTQSGRAYNAYRPIRARPPTIR